MSECTRAGKWIGGCRFEPRYDEPVLSAAEREFGQYPVWRHRTLPDGKVAIEEEVPMKTYVHDICIRCGKVVDRHIEITGTPTTPNPNRSE